MTPEEEVPYVPDPLLDEEVNEALVKNDKSLIWGMTATLATMDIEEYAIHRAAIKKRMNGSLSLSLLDKAVFSKRKEMEDEPPPSRPEEELPAWKKLLHRNENGNPQKVLINADIALRNAPEWQNVFCFDEFKQKVTVIGEPPIGGDWPRDWTDTDDTKTTVWLQEHGIYVGCDTVSTVVRSLSEDNRSHVVREYLTALKWDQISRVDGWLSTYLGAERNEYTIQVGRMWLISAVARIMHPGCKADYMLVLEGDQGIKKSTALEVLCSQKWFCDHTPDLHNKDAQMQIFGSWIFEWSELDALNRSEVTSVKSFITRRVEKFRPPHARYVIEVPRQCVFAGTTNRQDWQKDETGGRRFWPVWCIKADLAAIIADRDQIWAEAAYLYSSGAVWWPDNEQAHARIGVQQESRLDTDAWQEKIEAYVSTLDEVTISAIFTNCLGIELRNQNQTEKNRIGRVMKAIGWKYAKWRDKEVPGSPFKSGYLPPPLKLPFEGADQ